jgi:aromatic ring hydroxylase
MIKTVEEFLESLRDGRVIHNLGERVKDVTTHPVLRRTVKHCAMDWLFTNDPDRRDLYVPIHKALVVEIPRSPWTCWQR